MMEIFKHYTGNALLNNALQTIEILGEVDHVSLVTSVLLERLFVERRLMETNLRLKSYTMIFSKNGPLHNDAEFGRKIYTSLMLEIIRHCESEGDKICEVSGLRFQTSFSDFYKKVLVNVGYPVGKKKDVSIGRVWFPLIGSLGSDAQALPQAKFAVSIHPICLVVMQFLPLSAVLYKGGILLVDSINFQFSKEFIAVNVEGVVDKIERSSGDESIENIRDNKRSHYLLRAISILRNKEEDYVDYADLNLWSFSNSGTGASCEIDRIPNTLLRKVMDWCTPYLKLEVEAILNDPNRGNIFLDCLEKEKDCYLLYPASKYEGVSIGLFEKFQELIGQARLLKYARYIAGLMVGASFGKRDAKLLSKTDAYADVNYKIIVLKTLIEAAKEGKWSIEAHLNILGYWDELPVNASFGRLLKVVHFYYQWHRKDEQFFMPELPDVSPVDSIARNVLGWFVYMIDNDPKKKTVIKDILELRENSSVRFDEILVRAKDKLALNRLIPIMYNERWKFRMWGVLELLRVYYSQQEPIELEFRQDHFTNTNTEFDHVKKFCQDYLGYYAKKYGNSDTGALPLSKLKLHVLDVFPDFGELFYRWLEEAVENVNEYLKGSGRIKQWSTEELLYNRSGDKCAFFLRFAILYELNSAVQSSKM